MIIILEPQKDTYVTNLRTQNNDASLANVGRAATLDLFKLYNENKNAYSCTIINFSENANLINGEEFKIIDAQGREVTFIIDTGSNTATGITNVDSKVIVGVQDTNGTNNHAARFSEVINNVNVFENGLTTSIKAYNNSDNELILKQTKSGESGDTVISLPQFMSSKISVDGVNKFARIEYSNLLISFDLEEFKNTWNIDNTLKGAFDNLKAEIVLKDVTTGIAKPKDFSLDIHSLKKLFNEGTGKDTIHFSDSDKSNFKDFSDNDSWEVQNTISSSDIEKTSISSILKENTALGDEDLVFNITDFFKSEIVKNSPSNLGFLIKFKDEDLYNNKTYFVKRLGSRHLINKSLVPQLKIKIDDSTYNIPTNSFNKIRYLDNSEDFYLFNRANGNLISFNEPDNIRSGWSIKFNIGSLITNKDTIIPTNFSGDALLGTRKAVVSASEMSRYNSIISTYLENNKTYKDTIKWCYKNIESATSFVEGRSYKIVSVSDGVGAATDFTTVGAANSNVNTLFIATGPGAGTGTAIELDLLSVNVNDTSNLVVLDNEVSFIEGRLYKIVSVSDGVGAATDFTDIGAANSDVGTLFIATGPGAGTGSAHEIDISSIKEIEYTILTESVEFRTAETSNETRYENLVTSIRITENDLFASNISCAIEVYFVDTKKEFKAVNVPYELPSENIGEVFYQMYDVESGDIIIDYDSSTKMFYDGEKYKFNLFVPKIFKNKRVNFKFKYNDSISKVEKIIFNKKYSVRIQ